MKSVLVEPEIRMELVNLRIELVGARMKPGSKPMKSVSKGIALGSESLKPVVTKVSILLNTYC